ncbi:hypothetical protein TVAG_176960 [Trichomonas vaginalis G3]|uniref:Uncharacterized protein n=1 Tax=Trichomonas vaginalis (strain ATCC PRA-98 / G3) TaxID=412133 RepID=A2F9S8_TRIV3|nr:hypothetical protein TVAGG3_1057980 [Trichomonas vaginalis G3]EAX98326.1 hypothetical protein TVAG_176960 [Trichomonas vaginalis G3]KAI5494554.1 hypothetical protein TVAGG3_1057980 [Trichomonas vaginalis G3]|eukprot:XP_001311256.1 hypothetical protein [Trichomonas vaginalis G3]
MVKVSTILSTLDNCKKEIPIKDNSEVKDIIKSLIEMDSQYKDFIFKVYRDGLIISDDEKILNPDHPYIIAILIPLIINIDGQDVQILMKATDICKSIINAIKYANPVLIHHKISVFFQGQEIDYNQKIVDLMKPYSKLTMTSLYQELQSPMERLANLGFDKISSRIALLVTQDNFEEAEKELKNGNIAKIIDEASSPNLPIDQQSPTLIAVRIALNPDSLFDVVEEFYKILGDKSIFRKLPEFIQMDPILRKLDLDLEKIYILGVIRKYIKPGDYGNLVTPRQDFNWIYSFFTKLQKSNAIIMNIPSVMRLLLPDVNMPDELINRLISKGKEDGIVDQNSGEITLFDDYNDELQNELTDDEIETAKTYFAVLVESYANSGDMKALDELDDFFGEYDFEPEYIEQVKELIDQYDIRDIPINDLKYITEHAPQGNVAQALDIYLAHNRDPHSIDELE